MLVGILIGVAATLLLQGSGKLVTDWVKHLFNK